MRWGTNLFVDPASALKGINGLAPTLIDPLDGSRYVFRDPLSTHYTFEGNFDLVKTKNFKNARKFGPEIRGKNL